MEKINIIIDNKPLQVEKGQTVLKAAHAHGIEIPTLCYYELDGVKLENQWIKLDKGLELLTFENNPEIHKVLKKYIENSL